MRPKHLRFACYGAVAQMRLAILLLARRRVESHAVLQGLHFFFKFPEFCGAGKTTAMDCATSIWPPSIPAACPQVLGVTLARPGTASLAWPCRASPRLSKAQNQLYSVPAAASVAN